MTLKHSPKSYVHTVLRFHLVHVAWSVKYYLYPNHCTFYRHAKCSAYDER